MTIPLVVSSCHRDGGEAQARVLEKRVHVRTIVVDERAVPKTVRLTGVLEADRRSELAANAAGRVTKTFVEIGAHVKAGDAIVALDARAASIGAAEARANAESARQELATAKAECERYEKLHDKGAVTDEEYELKLSQCRTQAAQAAAARARVASAVQSVTDAQVRAPFGGVVADRFVNVGDFVREDSRVVTLLVDDPLRLRLTVPEPYIGYVRDGLPVTFETVARPGQRFAATVRYVGREVRSTTRDLLVVAIADNPEGTLVSGMFVTADLAIGTTTLPVVPKSALSPLEGSETVFMVVGDHVQRRVVQPGYREGNWVATLEGVTKGDRLVDAPPATLRDGALVE
jgi:membrane fusion protein (multidrug efflux system)